MRSIVAGLTLLALAAPAHAAAAPPSRCAPHRQEAVKARSASAVVLVHYADETTVLGCSRASGRRRILLADPRMLPEAFKLRGTRVGYVLFDEDHDELVADDAVHAGRREVLRTLPAGPDRAFVSAFALGPRGAVAWLEGRTDVMSLVLARGGDVTRTLDEGTALYDIGFTARSVTWHHDIEARNAQLAPRDRCPDGTARAGGNALLDVVATPVGAALCVRRTGALSDLAEADPAQVVLAGTWGAAWSGSRLEVLDAQSGARRTLATAGTPGPLVVDAHGSAAWAEVTTQPTPHTVVHADDAAGPRVLWEGDTVVPRLMHDRSEVLFAPAPGAADVTAPLSP